MARIVFMGTPLYAKRILAAVAQRGDHFLVVTKPDMLVGRHRRETPSAVAVWAQSQGLPLVRPQNLQELRPEVEAFAPDYILTAAYGRILPMWLLQMPKFGSYNLHASLLPRWRGPNPIAWAILTQDAHTGVTLMRMDAGVDTGPIVAQSRCVIDREDTTATLTEKLADIAGCLWIEQAQRWGLGEFPVVAQPSVGVTLAPKFDKDAGRVDWTCGAVALDAQIRSMTPDPGAYTICQQKRLKILRAQVETAVGEGPVGQATLNGNDWLVSTPRGVLRVRTIQPAGGRPMSPGDYVRGRRDECRWVLS